jgi:putative endonuclease
MQRGQHSVWFIYMIRYRKGYIYTGITTDVMRRYIQHQEGKGAKTLKGKGPLILIYSQILPNQSMALRIEYQFKKLSKVKKEQLITDNGIYDWVVGFGLK